ncbi:TetR/AcrR family transcriptional regulator [Pseudofrankia sp. DC12]|uniref:TetR/AcrR family transcriptional regulator n=2 Tax=Pseudofrankia sp. DC12 TaxID=683315 RepID=UPI0005F7925E|nr:TetR/AcrR family transcriptional regulator [Pseudofrankia sp. DC12]
MVRVPEKSPGREAQRLETRQRVFDAAIAEFRRLGMGYADIGAIVAAAGVARSTFYFHFPTKEHVLAALERGEQEQLAAELAQFLASPRQLPDLLGEVVRLVTGIEQRLGAVLFRDVLAFHFSPTRPRDSEWTSYPIVVLMVEALERARDRGEIHPEADLRHSAFFFLLGLYAILAAVQGPTSDRATILANFAATVLRGLEPR